MCPKLLRKCLISRSFPSCVQCNSCDPSFQGSCRPHPLASISFPHHSWSHHSPLTWALTSASSSTFLPLPLFPYPHRSQSWSDHSVPSVIFYPGVKSVLPIFVPTALQACVSVWFWQSPHCSCGYSHDGLCSMPQELAFSETLSLLMPQPRKPSLMSPHSCLLSTTKRGLLGSQFKEPPLSQLLMLSPIFTLVLISYFSETRVWVNYIDYSFPN